MCILGEYAETTVGREFSALRGFNILIDDMVLTAAGRFQRAYRPLSAGRWWYSVIEEQPSLLTDLGFHTSVRMTLEGFADRLRSGGFSGQRAATYYPGLPPYAPIYALVRVSGRVHHYRSYNGSDTGMLAERMQLRALYVASVPYNSRPKQWLAEELAARYRVPTYYTNNEFDTLRVARPKEG